MNESIVKLIVEVISEKIKLEALSKTLFDNNVISKDETNRNINKIMSDEKFLKEEISNLFSDNIDPDIIKSILNHFTKK